jgi:glutaredoxin-like YruB-family protein
MADKKKAIIYSTPTCPYCKMAKDYLGEQGVKYEDFDVSEDQERSQEMVKKSGQMGVPVIDIGGTIIIGFDKEKIDQALKK